MLCCTISRYLQKQDLLVWGGPEISNLAAEIRPPVPRYRTETCYTIRGLNCKFFTEYQTMNAWMFMHTHCEACRCRIIGIPRHQHQTQYCRNCQTRRRSSRQCCAMQQHSSKHQYPLISAGRIPRTRPSPDVSWLVLNHAFPKPHHASKPPPLTVFVHVQNDLADCYRGLP